MGNETINSIPNDFSDCTTKVQCSDFMKTYNDLNPVRYFELALAKIDRFLTEQQKERLQDYINYEEPEYDLGWDLYCDILTVEQIQIVGY